jgi:type IX secretion system PorP/SprF family membrane protein
MKKKILHFFIFCNALFMLQAQDPQFSQFYANPIYLNPAFTGMTYGHRMVANYRNQWMGIPKAYSTYAASYDYNFASSGLGAGAQFLQDMSGSSGLKRTTAAACIAWHGDIDRFTEWRGGFSASMNWMKLGFDKLVFNDQLYTGAVSSVEIANYTSKTYLDMNAGVLVSSLKYWAGLSAKHLNRADVDMSNADAARLPMTWSLHGGYRIVQEKVGRELKKYIAPTIHYKHHAHFDQLDVGVYYYKVPLQLGLWYRGIPLKHYSPGISNNDAIVIMLGYEMEEQHLKIGYSYDLSISKLISNTSGSHELAIIYELYKPERKSKRILITTPKF